MTTIEERVTLYTEQRQGQRIAVALVDPLPYINYSQETKIGDGEIKKERILPLPVYPRSPPPVSSVDELLQGHNFGKSQTFFKIHTSISDDLEAWMTEYAQHGLPVESSRLFVAILEIVSRDTRTTLSLLTAVLSEISLGSMYGSQEQERLASWQTLIRSYQADLPAMKNSLHEFVRWNNTPSYVHNKVRDLTNQTDDLISQVEKAHQALRAELSILESKRGIAEAEGVAKLTELAFIFIPLTFSASLFSMQVRELEENMPTLGGFVGVCLLFLFSSYGVRLAIRSRAVIDRKRELLRSIRRDCALEGNDVPTHVFISWIFNKLFGILFPEGKEVGRWTFAILFISAVLAPVLALIWTKTRIDTGLKAILTIVMIFLAFVVFYALQKRFKVFLTRALNYRGFLYWFERRRQRDEAPTPGETV
ncbi:hypothetical protein BFW01_g7569 [Lasiodiplodia theobromae]|nr:hypothetical protein BFW01_g7569 [Lasiodiplodia theobromae]